VAQYRAGEFAEAVKSLTESDKRNHVSRKDSVPEDLAFLAMAYHKLGQKDQAQATLTRLRDIMNVPAYLPVQSSRWADGRGFLLKEADSLLQEPPPSKKP
jgi:hypothetical protein